MISLQENHYFILYDDRKIDRANNDKTSAVVAGNETSKGKNNTKGYFEFS